MKPATLAEIAPNTCPCCGEPSTMRARSEGWNCTNPYCDVRTFRSRTPSAAPTLPVAASDASNPVTPAENSCHAPSEGAR